MTTEPGPIGPGQTDAGAHASAGVRHPSPPPPRYEAADEISLDDPSPAVATTAPTGQGSDRESGLPSTGPGNRAGRSRRMFPLWYAPNSSLFTVVVGAVLFALGLSLRQVAVATAIGVAASILVLGTGSLIGRATGKPTMAESRTAFGARGNVVPAIAAVIARVFWSATLLWLLSASLTRSVVSPGSIPGSIPQPDAGEPNLQAVFLVAAAVAGVAVAAALAGYRAVAVMQMAVTLISAAATVGFIALTLPHVDLRVAVTIGDGPSALVLSGSVIVFGLIGLLWANGSADLARYQRAESKRVSTFAWAGAGAGLPAVTLIPYGALLAASEPATAAALVTDPVDAIAGLLPAWYFPLFVAAAALGLLAAAALSVYSGGFALQAAGVRVPRASAVAIAGAAALALSAAIAALASDDRSAVRDLATTVSVPTAAWAGVFIGHRLAGWLAARGGAPDRGAPHGVDWNNLAMFGAATIAGFGLVTAGVPWLAWQGFLFALADVPLDSALAGSDLGLFAAIAVGLLAPLVRLAGAGRTPTRGSHRTGSRERTLPGQGSGQRPVARGVDQ